MYAQASELSSTLDDDRSVIVSPIGDNPPVSNRNPGDNPSIVGCRRCSRSAVAHENTGDQGKRPTEGKGDQSVPDPSHDMVASSIFGP
jgi:hypothetical protein